MAIITDSQREQFDREGYLVIENLLDPADAIDPIIDEYHGVLDRLARALFREGRIPSIYEDCDFSERLIRISEATNQLHTQHFDFTLPQGNIKPDTPIWPGPAIFDMLRNPDLLDVVECLIGPEIWSNPVQHVRLKLPENRGVRDEEGQIQDGATVWHQDNGVVRSEADETETLTVWFPLWDAPVESGCLAVLPRSKEKGLRTHCVRKGWVTIPDQILELDEAVPLPMKRGDVLLLHRHTCHSSIPNKSDRIRWSFDLRYNPIGQPTGRDVFPGFVARSRKNPDQELRDPERWAALWHEARAALADRELEPFNRWDNTASVCA